MKRRIFSILLSGIMVFSLCSQPVHAEENQQISGITKELCEHHTEHTTECGYEAPVEGHECEHVHDDECGYAEGHACEHVHDEECGYVESSEGNPCTFVCDICGNEAEPEETNLSAAVLAVQKLIDALPDAEDITEENFDEVSDMLGEIDTAKEALTDEEIETLDFTKYDAAVAKMMELMGQAGAGEAAVMSISGIDFSSTGNNGATVKTINLNAAALRPDSTWSTGGKLVYFGTYNSNPVAYRVLSAPNTQESSENYLLLDCNTILLKKPFDADCVTNSVQTTNPTEWKGSDLEAWLNGNDFYENVSVFSTLEKTAIANTALAAQNSYTAGNYDFSYQDYSAANHVFCLSAAEADGLYADNAARKKTDDAYWWLRSAHSYINNHAGLVSSGGRINGNIVNSKNVGVSPALNVNLSSVLFASVSGADKSSALASVSNSSSATQWKLTLRDSSKTVNVTSGQNVERTDAGGSTKITVPYTYTDSNTTNPVSQISVMITDKAYTDSSAQVLYYGALQGVTISNLAGTGTFTLPTELADETCGTDYYAYIVAEDVNEATATDYASAPVQITIPTSASKFTVTVTNGTLSNGSTTGDYAQGETVTITANTAPSGQQFKEWTVVSGTISLASSTSETTTFTMPAEPVSVKAVYKDSSNPGGGGSDNQGDSGSENPDTPSNPNTTCQIIGGANSSWTLGSTTSTINANTSGKKDDVPKTGDNTPIVWLLILAGLSGTGLILTGKKGKKNGIV